MENKNNIQQDGSGACSRLAKEDSVCNTLPADSKCKELNAYGYCYVVEDWAQPSTHKFSFDS